MAGNNEVITRDKALEICRDFLGGAWMDISSSDMIYKPITGGLNSALHLCALPDTQKRRSDEPVQALFRMYGKRYTPVMTETVIFTIFSERRLGPRLYGIFPGGRLEEYIPVGSLPSENLHDPDISAAIARTMAKVHTLNAPVIKHPSSYFPMRNWLSEVQSSGALDAFTGEKKILADKVMSYDWLKELDWVECYLTAIGCPVVFCHNDLHKGNILLPDGPGEIEDRMVFIDFEYCGYNYRGNDFAMFFTEWGYDYTAPVYPYFAAREHEYPTSEEQLRFVRAYVDALSDSGHLEDPAQRTALETKILDEARAFVLSAHLQCIFWTLSQACTSDIKFGFLEYAVMRVDAYSRWKEHLLNKTPLNRKRESVP